MKKKKEVTFKPLKKQRYKCNLCKANVGKRQLKLHRRMH